MARSFLEQIDGLSGHFLVRPVDRPDHPSGRPGEEVSVADGAAAIDGDKSGQGATADQREQDALHRGIVPAEFVPPGLKFPFQKRLEESGPRFLERGQDHVRHRAATPAWVRCVRFTDSWMPDQTAASKLRKT